MRPGFEFLPEIPLNSRLHETELWFNHLRSLVMLSLSHHKLSSRSPQRTREARRRAAEFRAEREREAAERRTAELAQTLAIATGGTIGGGGGGGLESRTAPSSRGSGGGRRSRKVSVKGAWAAGETGEGAIFEADQTTVVFCSAVGEGCG